MSRSQVPITSGIWAAGLPPRSAARTSSTTANRSDHVAAFVQTLVDLARGTTEHRVERDDGAHQVGGRHTEQCPGTKWGQVSWIPCWNPSLWMWTGPSCSPAMRVSYRSTGPVGSSRILLYLEWFVDFQDDREMPRRHADVDPGPNPASRDPQ